ncbi:MAG: hypothetical protein ACM3UU_02380 [Ignavibacteriales bacterium]
MIDYTKKIYLTFDLDWACDDILNYFLDLLESEKVAATIFVTHNTPVLQRIKGNKLIEIGIHPNIEKAFESNNPKSIDDIIHSLKEYLPEAVSIRSHSLMQSTRLLNIFYNNGFTHDLNTFIPSYSNMELKAFKHPNGIIKVPFFWEDDLFCIAIKNGYEKNWDVNRFVEYKGIKVFNFHPIHIFLNTEDLGRYESCREYHRNVNKLKEFSLNEDYGSRVFLLELIKKVKSKGMEFGLIKEIVPKNLG